MENAFPDFIDATFLVASSRPYRAYKEFELTVDRLIGERVRSNGADGAALWSALANTCWHGPANETVSYSYRSAGDLVARVREEGSYMDWYCSGPPSVVAPWIVQALGTAGWHADICR